MSDSPDDHRVELEVGDLNDNPGLIAKWDQIRQDARVSLANAEDFFYLACLQEYDGEIGLTSWVAFRHGDVDNLVDNHITVMELVRDNVDEAIRQMKEKRRD